ncbi:hypothetical protein [Natrarchaeobaculum aegyptiacum]|uniref:DoxX family protein n=1 Tax=Natrarchaeobaculum aegyptiacum TaxID=745377 RepID=A0A2Z2HU76_9EURY|nr:hypothetical protein [Natrarchaeobaculum aegyptiacum]ARS89037.1 hypothetical protein B1756_04215 [Natrarchaeobaculum aegyptiacum]
MTDDVNDSSKSVESRYGGVTLEGEPHALSAWFVVGLRLTMGLAFLGLDRVVEQRRVGGQPLVERYSKLRYLLG